VETSLEAYWRDSYVAMMRCSYWLSNVTWPSCSGVE